VRTSAGHRPRAVASAVEATAGRRPVPLTVLGLRHRRRLRAVPGGWRAATARRARWQRVLGVDGGVLTTVSLEERDDLAIEEGQVELRVSGAVVDSGSQLVLHRWRLDGSWRYAIDIWNSDQAPAMS
jgi:hypothetical protein